MIIQNTNGGMKQIAIDIQKRIHHLQASWISKNSSYEKKLCSVFNWKVVNSRYYDAITETNALVEIKKGINGMHFDMIRYAEILLGHGVQNTITLYFHWKKDINRVTDVCIINTKVLINFLQINNYFANVYLQVKQVVPRNVSVCANLTSLDLRKLADYIVFFDGRLVDNSKVDKSKYAPTLLKKQKKETIMPQKPIGVKKTSIKYYLY